MAVRASAPLGQYFGSADAHQVLAASREHRAGGSDHPPLVGSRPQNGWVQARRGASIRLRPACLGRGQHGGRAADARAAQGISDRAALLLVGDVDQLPSFGPGQALPGRQGDAGRRRWFWWDSVRRWPWRSGTRVRDGDGRSCASGYVKIRHLAPWRSPERGVLVSVCRRQALSSSATRRLKRRERMEMNAIATNAMRCSFERSKMVFNRR
jgi:hypothetical protein